MRFVAIDNDEVYYITDTQGLKTLEDYIKEFSKPEYEFTKDEALEKAKEEYWQMIYENSMTATENVDTLNKLDHENFELALELENHKHPLYSTREAERILNEKEEHIRKLHEENKQLKEKNNLFFKKVFNLLLKYQKSINRKMADEVLEELGIELTEWFE